MKKRFVRVWEQADTPLIWVEMVYTGDTIKMKKYMGFSYEGHYFSSHNQVTSFYKNLASENKAEKFGLRKYSKPDFIKYYCDKSANIEKALLKSTSKFTNLRLQIMPNKTLTQRFQSFFDTYSSLYGFYRFSRPEFYQRVLGKNKKIDAQMEKVGHRRYQMHQAWMRAFREARPLFEEIGKRIGLPWLEVQNCSCREIINALQGRGLPRDTKKRVKGFGFYYQKNSYQIRILKPALIKQKNLASVHGQSAYPGKVRGRVLLVGESLAGVKLGQLREIGRTRILVTEMTSPDMVPIIKRVKAIVTDEGGVLCHAAIVAREMKKPCIIGTKVATKVFKDGDLVEVDANKGTVRKLK